MTMAGASATDEKLAERIDELARTLTDFRVDAAGKFSSIETELRLIRKVGERVLGAMIAGVGMMIVWAALAAWYGSALNSRVEQHGQRLDAMDKKLDLIISRIAPKAAG
jgi:hypothetical protein